MEHQHEGLFCLKCSLEKITPLLPHQGPIKDFIHQNTLEVFLNKPFDEAIIEGSSLFRARTYMDLSYYRNRYREGDIREELLNEAIQKQFSTTNRNDTDTVKHALLNFVEIHDEKTFDFCTRQQFSRDEVNNAKIAAHNYCSRLTNAKSVRHHLIARLGRDPGHVVNPILFRLIGSYLDQGVNLWPYLDDSHSFLDAILNLLRGSVFPIAAFVDNKEIYDLLTMPTDEACKILLGNILADESTYFDYIKDSLLDHPGWSGMINIVARHPHSLAKQKNISVEDVLVVKLALEWQAIKHIDRHFDPLSIAASFDDGKSSVAVLSLAYWLIKLPHAQKKHALLSKITLMNLQRVWHEAFEESYYHSIAKIFSEDVAPNTTPTTFQAVFCIDDRECSMRRHLESTSSAIETFSYPGFFAVDYYFKPHKNDLLEKMCPAPVTPKHVVMESNVVDKNPRHRLFEFASFITRHGSNSMLFGFISAYTLGHVSLLRLIIGFLKPIHLSRTHEMAKKKKTATLIFERQKEKHQDLFIGFTHDEMAERVYRALHSMGLEKDFAPLVFLIGHGSSSVNNPHFAAYDCGACSGRPGAINARLFAAMANIPVVREKVALMGIDIPASTHFVGGYHDTATDEFQFFDTEILGQEKHELFKSFLVNLNVARAKNAKERCKRFAVVSSKISNEEALVEVHHRAHSLFEARPELNHANNALCIVGRRKRSLGKNFDRRAFLQSYDPTMDSSGEILGALMSAVIPVCGGINLEYFFSRIDPAVYGCGTKLSHNVCSLIGVGNGLDDDLRTGLPIQMTEVHDPVRLLIVIEQSPEVIVNTISKNPALLTWVKNAWVKLASLDPNRNNMIVLDESYWKSRTAAVL